MRPADLAWLAGILEGEGCFRITRRGLPTIHLKMTDRDIVIRVADLIAGTAPRECRRDGGAAQKANRKVVWGTDLAGQAALALMRRLLPWMGVRRSARIREIVAARAAIEAARRRRRMVCRNGHRRIPNPNPKRRGCLTCRRASENRRRAKHRGVAA